MTAIEILNELEQDVKAFGCFVGTVDLIDDLREEILKLQKLNSGEKDE